MSCKKKKWTIIDWAYNPMFEGKEFDSFEDAEEYLGIFLDDDYDECRGEYSIIKDIKDECKYVSPFGGIFGDVL